MASKLKTSLNDKTTILKIFIHVEFHREFRFNSFGSADELQSGEAPVCSPILNRQSELHEVCALKKRELQHFPVYELSIKTRSVKLHGVVFVPNHNSIVEQGGIRFRKIKPEWGHLTLHICSFSCVKGQIAFPVNNR